MSLKTRFCEILAGICILIISSMLLVGCNQQDTGDLDTVKYEEKEYVFIEYPMNEFYYDYNGSSHDNFEEVDGIYPVDSSKWDMIWNGGDLYCAKDYAKEANRYYADDENYDCYIVIDTEDEGEENAYLVNLTEEELDSIYDLEEKEKTTSAFWEEFEAFGSIIKISKDGMVRGTISIAKFSGNWYWKSEIIDESREEDGTWPEYIQPLPETLDSKIKEAEGV